MQQLSHTGGSSVLSPGAAPMSCTDLCAWEMLDAIPPLTWFVRRHMCQHRKGFSVPQFRALVWVEHACESSVSALAEHLVISLPTASRIVAGLVNKGLIRRAACPSDRRQIALHITTEGESILEQARAYTHASLVHEVQHLSSPERATVIESMRILKRRFGALGRRLSEMQETTSIAPAKETREPKVALPAIDVGGGKDAVYSDEAGSARGAVRRASRAILTANHVPKIEKLAR